jgi:glutamate racemase
MIRKIRLYVYELLTCSMIGIFDSGSGGLSVLKALRERVPNADVVYFGDLKNAPYGNKSREELGALTVLGIQKLIDEGATEIVSACNSVSVSIVLPMFEILDIPRVSIIEMVGPTVSSFKGTSAKVLVVATKATVESKVYQDGFRIIGIEAEGVAVPELVSVIESGSDDDVSMNVIRKALLPYQGKAFTHVLLGCTHYPLVRHVFKDVLQELDIQGKLFDPANPVTDAVCKRFATEGGGQTRFLLTQDSEQFRTHLARQLGGIASETQVI